MRLLQIAVLLIAAAVCFGDATKSAAQVGYYPTYNNYNYSWWTRPGYAPYAYGYTYGYQYRYGGCGCTPGYNNYWRW